MTGSTCGNSPKRIAVSAAAAGLARMTVSEPLRAGCLDRLGKKLAESAEIGNRDREHAGKRSEPDDSDKHQRPDQCVDAADRVEASADQEAQSEVPDGTMFFAARRLSGAASNSAPSERAEERDRQGFAHACQKQMQLAARRRWEHQPDVFAELRTIPVPSCSTERREPPDQNRNNATAINLISGRRADGAERLGPARVTRPHGGGDPAASRGYARASWPNSRPRIRSVTRSISETVRMIISRIALTSV